MIRGVRASKGFALPTILIASIVMLAVLLVSVSSTTAVRNAILNQYYSQLAQIAGEAGVAHAQACLEKYDNVPIWSDANPLTPSTSCNGAQITGTSTVRALIVAGGGGGGTNMGGGGGGGGVIYKPSLAISTGSFPVVVGAGGAGAPAGTGAAHPSIPGTNGEDSSFKSLTAIGGGRGGSSPNAQGLNIEIGAAGGSGGGASGYNSNTSALGAIKGGAGTSGQGYAGGNQGNAYYSGGGGGAGGVGASGNSTAHGGVGVANDILGPNYYWGGGGGGGGYSIVGGNGGNGGGGGGAVGATTGGAGLNNGAAGGGGSVNAQTNTPGGNGGANTGGGGGGGAHYNATNKGGDGGSGIVVISYPFPGAITATGGTVTDSGGYRIHKFTSSGTFVITADTGSICPSDVRCSVTKNGNVRSSYSVGLPTIGANSVQVLVVGGGGGAGGAGSGGGGGGYVYNPSFPITASSLPLSLPVSVGGGGSGGVGAAPGTKGQNSTFSTITAEGGGYGVSHGAGNGGDGGSGGGGALITGGVAPLGGRGSQGYPGGDGVIQSGWISTLGGGGGAGGPGKAACEAIACGNGGDGKLNWITGSPVYYAAGGGAGEINSAAWIGGGGRGGGGSGYINAAGTSGATNTGSGGGGGSYNGGYANGGAGGSGVVIVSYPTGSLTATGGTVTTVGTNTIHKFTNVGASTFSVNTLSVKNTIPNSGYVEVTRTSDPTQVWRTYTQPAAQPAVIPGLCSGTDTSALGWNTVTKLTANDSFPVATASTISISTDKVYPGPMYFRKSFSVTKADTYTLKTKADDAADVFIDSARIHTTSSSSTVSSNTVSLAVGCHTLFVKLTNNGIAKNNAKLTLALSDSSSTPLVVTDTTWRVAAGALKHFSEVNYYADPASWTVVRDYQDANAVGSTWNAVSGIPARAISTTHSYTSTANYPATSYTYFRDSNTVTVTSPTEVLITYICDDACNVYLDGQVIASGLGGVTTTTLTLTEGSHKFGMSGYNSALGLGDYALAVKRISDGAALTFTNPGWLAANFWETANYASTYYSYDNAYSPNPTLVPSTTVKVLAVGGGGGGGSGAASAANGGGGGGGGVVYNSAFSVSIQTYSVTVGTGGAANANGVDSVFGSITATGGGKGGGGAALIAGGSGGSGGGGSSSTSGASAGGASLVVQGNKGAASVAGSPYRGGGGGGAAEVGSTDGAGYGGDGVANLISGISLFYGGGGGAGADSGPGLGGDGGGGNGVIYTSPTGGVAGTPNSGGGGGGGASQGSSIPGGSGGSGIVVISFASGTMTVAVTGGGTCAPPSGGNVICTFVSSGTFTVTSIP